MEVKGANLMGFIVINFHTSISELPFVVEVDKED